MSFMASVATLMRQHELADLRAERDAALAENARLRELYENAVGNRERFGWTINHLLECEEALRVSEAQQRKAEQVLVAADRLHQAYDAMLHGRDMGRLGDWEPMENV